LDLKEEEEAQMYEPNLPDLDMPILFAIA